MKQLLSPPIFEDADKTYTARMLHVIVLLGLGVSLILLPLLALLVRPSDAVQLLTQAAANLLVFGGLFYLTRKGFVRAASWLLIGLFLVLTLTAAIHEGGVRSGSYAALTVLVLAAGLLQGNWAGVFTAVVCAVVGYGLVVAEQQGLIAPQPEQSPLTVWANTLTLIIILVGLQSLATYLSRLALKQAQKDLAERRRAEVALLESEKRYRSLLENTPVVTYINGLELESPTLYVSPQVGAWLGYSHEAFIAERDLWTKIVHPDDAVEVMAENTRTMLAEERFSMDYRLVTKDGRTVWTHDEAVLVRDDAGKPQHWLGVWTDITERKRAEEALGRSEERYRLISTVSSDYMFSTHIGADDALHLEWVAGAFEPITGYTFESYLAHGGWTAALHPDDRQQDADDFATLEQNKPIISELRTIHRDGSIRWVRVYAHPNWDETRNRLIGIYGAVQNITEQKLAEAALRASEQLYRHAIEAAGAVPYYQDHQQNRYAFMGEGILEMTGYTSREMSPDLWMSIVKEEYMRGETASLSVAEARQASRNKQLPIWRSDAHILTKEGKWRWIADSSVEVTTPEGEVVGSVGVLQDISERKRAESSLRESEQLYRRAIAAAGAVPYYLDYPTRTYKFMGEGILQITGYPPQEMTPELIGELEVEFHLRGDNGGLSKEEAVSQTRQGELGEWKSDLLITARDGQRRWLADSSIQVFDDGGNVAGAIGILQDITERKLAEKALADQAEEIEGLYKASAELLTASNDMAALCQRITEIVVNELGFVECGLWLIQEDQKHIKRMAYSGTATVGFNLTSFREGEGLIGTALSTGKVVYAPDVNADPRYIEGDPSTRSELVVPLKVADSILGIINMENEQLAAFSERQQRVLTAFAERAALAIENARLVSTLEQALSRANELTIEAEEASRLKSQFLTNTSHELRTPLTSVIGSLDIVLNELCSTKAEEKQFLSMAIEAAQGLTLIVDDLLEIAKIESGAIDLQTQITLVAPILEEAFSLNRVVAVEKNLTMQVTGPATSTLIQADPDKLRRILHNLIGNAVKFTNEGSVNVTVNTDPKNNLMIIEVADTGIGIAPEAQSQLFQPFVQVDGSTTRKYGGTGLGLTISRRLAEMMHGSLTLVSKGVNQGTLLTLTLPLADLEPSQNAKAGSN